MSDLSGQQIVTPKLADGDYWILIHVNQPADAASLRIRETTKANNTSYAQIRLSAGASHLEYLCGYQQPCSGVANAWVLWRRS